MRDDFNSQAMEQKIRTNLDLGWTIDGIKAALRTESSELIQKMRVMEARVLELQDQIEYMDKNYGQPS